MTSGSPHGTHVSQIMVIEAKRKEMERFKRMKVYRVVTRKSMESDEGRRFQAMLSAILRVQVKELLGDSLEGFERQIPSRPK